MIFVLLLFLLEMPPFDIHASCLPSTTCPWAGTLTATVHLLLPCLIASTVAVKREWCSVHPVQPRESRAVSTPTGTSCHGGPVGSCDFYRSLRTLNDGWRPLMRSLVTRSLVTFLDFGLELWKRTLTVIVPDWNIGKQRSNEGPIEPDIP